MKLAICNELFEGWAFDRVCRFARSAGYAGLELAPFTLATSITTLPASRRAELRAQAEDARLEIVGLHWLLAGTEGLHLTSPDRDVRERTVEYLVALAEACHDLGGHVMVFGSPRQRSRLPGISEAQAFDLATEAFRRAMPFVAASGVTICMEPLSPAETDFVTTASDAVRLIDAVGHPSFVLHLDVKAMSSESTPVPDLIRRHAGRAGHVHVNDANGRGPGFGDTDFVPILQALDETGYDRWVSLEVFDFSPDPATIALRSLQYLQACAGTSLKESRA
jgi:sugar phosphate isomerase/epimerase